MSLASLVCLLAIVVLVEGNAMQWKEKHTVCKSHHCMSYGSVEAEVANGGQELDTVAGSITDHQTRSGESVILADSKEGVTCPHWLFPIRTENGSTVCECGNAITILSILSSS